MPCPAHRYDTLLSACIYIGAIEPSARVPDTNLSLPYTPSRSASLPLRSSHTLAYIFTVRGCAACASTTIHIAHRHHVALSGRQLPSHSVVAPLTRTSAGVMRTVVAWWHASPIHVARHALPSWQEHIDTTIACPIEPDSCHYLRNGLADVGRVTGEVIRYGQPEPMRL